MRPVWHIKRRKEMVNRIDNLMIIDIWINVRIVNYIQVV